MFNKYASVLTAGASTPAMEPDWRAMHWVGWFLQQLPVIDRRLPEVSGKRWLLRDQILREWLVFIDVICLVFGAGADPRAWHRLSDHARSMQINTWEGAGCISDEEDRQAAQSFCSSKFSLLNPKQFNPPPISIPHPLPH